MGVVISASVAVGILVELLEIHCLAVDFRETLAGHHEIQGILFVGFFRFFLKQISEPVNEAALLRTHGSGVGHTAHFSARPLLQGVAELVGQQTAAGGVIFVESSTGEEDFFSGRKGVHAPFCRSAVGVAVRVNAHGGRSVP